MLPLSQKANRDIPKASSFFSLQRKTTGCTTYLKTPIFKRRKNQKAISLGITIPESAAKKTQMSKQICTTT